MRASRLLTLALALAGAASAASAQTPGGTGGREIPKIDPRQAPLRDAKLLPPPEPPPARATGLRPVSLENGFIRLSVPNGLAEADPETMPAEFADVGVPDYLFMDPRGTAAVAVSGMRWDAAPLATIRALLEQQLGRQHPDVRFLTREVVEVEGRRWVHLEFAYDGERAGIHKRMLAMWFRGNLLVVELASHSGSRPDYREILRETVRSVRVRG